MLAQRTELVAPDVRHGPHESGRVMPQALPAISPYSADTETVYLCPFDLMYARCWTHRFLVFHMNDNNHERAIQDLNNGLCRLGALVPYIKGRVFKPAAVEQNLEPEGNLRHPRNRLVLSWSRTAPALKVRELPVPGARKFPSLVELADQKFPAHYFTKDLSTLPSAWTPHTINAEAGAPVLDVGFIRTEGGLILSITNHHGVFDGVGSCDLIRLWAACTRGSTPDVVADADAPLMRSSKLSEYIDNHFQRRTDSLPHCAPSITGPQVVDLGRRGDCRASIFAFSGDKIQLAKQALDHSKLVNNGNNTVNNIIHAILWSCITRARLPKYGTLGWRTKQSRLGLAVNGRPKIFGLEVGITSPYLGNLTFVAVADIDVSQLDDVAQAIFYHQEPSVMARNLKGLVPLVDSLATAAEKIDISYISQVFSGINMADDMDSLARPIVPGTPFSAYEGMNLNCSSWANMDFYKCDFGPAFCGKTQRTGTPVAVRFICDDPVDGAIMLLPRKRTSLGGERIEVHVSLNTDDLQALEEDQVLQSWLCE
ncbi:hypothetical protein J7T55_005286 [Diaporthe amygdali]|uniref:uncharacterized protein n=1 Tax=Phomopsis amygdali TaxID=1214568 RepID=UPI0022FE9F4C|nr:uncharacterized protein J7T55_005286 [Diaporthe amygdali]KAJ0108309.1 hypothetical protein J7T55_005286 [Diaporthe amygdali]